jgi:AGCS family alanine or glycine:cation symporter
LFGARTSLIYKMLFLFFTFLGSVVTRGNILTFSDLMILGMSLPNLLGVFILSGLVKERLDEYWSRYKAGELDKSAEEVHHGVHHPHRDIPPRDDSAI